MVDSFLNGIIIVKRGKPDSELGQPDSSELAINRSAYIPVKESKNYISITEDMMDIVKKAGNTVSTRRFIEKKGNMNYKECRDKYARNYFLKRFGYQIQRIIHERIL